MQRQAFGRLCFCSIWAAEPDWVRWWMKPVAPHDALWLERSTLRRILTSPCSKHPRSLLSRYPTIYLQHVQSCDNEIRHLHA